VTNLVARLYRGPAANKRFVMKPDTAAINVPAMNRSREGYRITTHRYVRTNHTHPDGSVYFEWDKPRGTKIK
jgi:hypothetical protein